MAEHPVPKGKHRSDEATERLEREVPEQILLPYQRAWVADDSQVKIYEKSRRIGVSWAEAADAALYAAQEDGGDVYYLAYSHDMTRGFVEDAAWWARWYDLSAGEMEEKEVVFQDADKAIKVFEIRFSSGNKIQALPSTPRNLRSKGDPGDRAILDEFAFVDEPEELMKAAMAFTIWGGGVHIISTHNGEDNAFNQTIEEARAGKKPYSVHRTTFREAVEQGLYDRINLVAGGDLPAQEEWMQQVYDQYGDEAAEELDVEPSESGGRYFSRLVVRRCMSDEVPVKRLSLAEEFATRPQDLRRERVRNWWEMEVQPTLRAAPPDLKGYAGMDFARSGDLSALLPAQESEDLVLECLVLLELRGVPYEQQRQLVEWTLESLPRLTHAAFDATGNGAYLAEMMMQRFGSPRVTQQKMSNAWYRKWMPRYRARLEDRQLVLPKHVDVIDDHSDVDRRRGVPKIPQGDTRQGSDGGQRHGDTAIAGGLLSYAAEQEGGEIDVQTDGSQFAGQALRDDSGPQRRVDPGAGFGAVSSDLSFDGYE